MMLASCHSSKKVTADTGNVGEVTTVSTATNTNNSTKGKDNSATNTKKRTIAAGTNFTAKVKVSLTRGEQNISTNGMLRMRYDDVIQLTLVDPILGITEVGRMELSPDSMLIIDRINKRYVSTQYDQFSATKSRNIDFNTIQELFWNESENSDNLSYTIPAKQEIKLDLKLYDKGSSDKWDAHTTVSSKYMKTDAEKLFKSLVQ